LKGGIDLLGATMRKYADAISHRMGYQALES